MKTTHALLIMACSLVLHGLSAQDTSRYDARFILASIDCENNTICLQTQFRAVDGEDFNLAGVNYRLFYDGSMADYITGSGKSLLPVSQYGSFPDDPKSDVQNVDASQAGFALSFANTLSFLNYSIDLMSLSTGGINLPASGEWISTTELCFDVTEELINDPSVCLEMVWARMGLTDRYATAFLEVAEWIQPNVTFDAATNVYDDLGPEDGENSCITSACPGGADPETTPTACSDNIDNDMDGLIDCNDPNCESVDPCISTTGAQYDIALDLTANEVDCNTGMVCYDINLQSPGSSFRLGTQEYRLFYNSANGSFLSAESMLGDDYQALSLQNSTPRENVDATGTGDLPYEATLGYVDFTIQLSDPANEPSVLISPDSPTTVAKVCFTMSANVIINPDECFEANWAREGLTTPYEIDVVNIFEWQGANSVVSASGSTFSDLDGMSGDDACFSATCAQACNAQVPDISGSLGDGERCDFATGIINFTSTGGNNSSDYTTQYALTDARGLILQLSNSSTIEIADEGYYVLYAINYRNDDAPEFLDVGVNIDNINATGCSIISTPFPFTVCEALDRCDFCLGESLTLLVDPNDPPDNFTTRYVITTTQGEIIAIQETDMYQGLMEGVFSSFAVNYRTDEMINGLEVGQFIYALSGASVEISPAYVFGVCDQLNPTIFFDLQGCDIETNALLNLGQNYTSYEWSNGSNAPEILVSATTPATYSVTVMLATGCMGIASVEVTGNEVSKIGDYVWEDADANGMQDDDETGLNGVTVNLYTDFDRNGQPDFPDFPSCTTTTGPNPNGGAAGYYEFAVYRANYVVEFIHPEGFVSTMRNQGDDDTDSDINENGLTGSIRIEEGVFLNNIDAGFRTSSSIGGSVWEDIDADGRRDGDEVGLNDVTINLYTADGTLVTSVMSDSVQGTSFLGAYCFEEIPVGDYYVEIVLPDGGVLSPPNASSNDLLDSEATGANGPNTTDIITTAPGEKTEGIDFGAYFGGQICGLVWRDAAMSANGLYDVGIDTVIENSLVYLLDVDSGDTILTAITMEDGTYCFESVPVGSYRVGFQASSSASAYVQQNVGDDPNIDSDVNTESGTTEVIFVGSQQVITGINAGLRMGVVPITLISFDGYWDEGAGQNVLSWITAVEINNDRFEVERVSGNGSSFEIIGIVDGAGTSLGRNYYTFVDTDIKEGGIYYYRLRQVDFGGGSEVTDIIAINVDKAKSGGKNSNSSSMRTFPNPARDHVQIAFSAEKASVVDIYLMDMMGRTVSEWKKERTEKGQNTLRLDVSQTQVGTYTLVIMDEEKMYRGLIQIMK